MTGVISRRTGYLMVIGGSVLFACTGVMSKAAIDGGVAPLELAAFRSYGASLILLPFLLLTFRRLTRRDLVPVLLFALIGIVLAQGLYYQAISRMDIAVALVIVYTGPLLVAAYQRLFHAERLPVIAYIAMCLAVGGVAIAVLGESGGIGAGMLAAALIWLPVIPVWHLPFNILGDPTQLTGRIDVSIPVGGAVLFTIVLGSVIPYALVITGITRIGAGAGSMAGMTEPIVAPLLAWFVLGQTLAPLQAVGITVTIACVAVVERQRFKHASPTEILVAEL